MLFCVCWILCMESFLERLRVLYIEFILYEVIRVVLICILVRWFERNICGRLSNCFLFDKLFLRFLLFGEFGWFDFYLILLLVGVMIGMWCKVVLNSVNIFLV